MEETDIVGFACDQQTFLCTNVDFDQIVQVTPVSVRLISLNSKLLLNEWKPPMDKTISVVACNTCQVLCAASSELYYLEILEGILVCKANITLQHEVACLDITPLNEGNPRAELAAVGLWTDISARILRLPSLEELNKEFLGGGIIIIYF